MAEENIKTEEEMSDKLIDGKVEEETVSGDVTKKDTFPIFFNCTICFQSFTEGGGTHVISTLPCGHIFGKSCLIKWFSTQTTDYFCPTCKTPLNELKLKGKDNVYDSIIPLYGLTNNTSLETVVLSRQKLIDDYEEKINELSTQNIKLKEQLKNILRLRREAFSLRSFAIDREDDIVGFERLLNELTGSESRTNTSSPSRSRRFANFSFINNHNTNEGGSQSVINIYPLNRTDIDRTLRSHSVRNNRDANLLSESTAEVNINLAGRPSSLFSNERGTDFINMIVATRYSPTVSSSTYKTVRKYRVCFDDVNDASYSDGLIVSAVKTSVRNDEISQYGLSFFRYLRGSMFLSLSDQEIVSVRVIKDPISPNIQRVIAVCNKGKFYNIKFDEENFRVVSKFEGIIGQSQNFSGRAVLLHKPTGLSWLTPDKYAIGTKRGHVFVRTFFENTTRWQSINRYTNTHGEIHTGLKKPILMIQSINDHAVVCFQLDCICIFDDRSGREVVYKCDGDILSINFNKYSNTIAVVLGNSRNRSQFRTLKVENVNFFFEDGIENYTISSVSSTLHNESITERIELNSIVLKSNNVDTIATFWINGSSENLSLMTTSGSQNLMNQIDVDSSRIIKVCNEEGVYSIGDSQKLNYMVVSKTNVTVYELGLNHS
uniref:RING-type domain-containing protein n=1 Tax=Strongyloides papillosus TaxID=174720 RepID=A0A0N5BFH6_STREA